MDGNATQALGTLLGLASLLIIVRYGAYSRSLLTGVIYLIFAGYMSLICVVVTTKLRSENRKRIPNDSSWYLRRRAQILLLVGWEFLIIGWLNIQGISLRFYGYVLIGYISVGLFIILSYKIVALADDKNQKDGSMPLNYFGRPRSRRIFFAGFIYTPIGLLIILSLAWSSREWCPAILQPPQIWFLVLALVSIAAAGMVFQRYHSVSSDRPLAIRLFTATACVVLLSTVIRLILSYNIYIYTLSSTAVVCIAAAAYWLALAKKPSIG